MALIKMKDCLFKDFCFPLREAGVLLTMFHVCGESAVLAKQSTSEFVRLILPSMRFRNTLKKSSGFNCTFKTGTILTFDS
jgi:hypothetical protein